jgi:glyoxylase-like metal-dependent hydrolase (beta-lactamase superfamily II)
MWTIRSFVFSPIQENTYVLHNAAGDALIIDPGCYFDEERRQLEGYVADKKLQPRFLLNTHCHLDHVFGNRFVHERYGLTLHLHEKEKKVLEFAPTSGLMYNMPFDNYAGNLNYLSGGDILFEGEDQLLVIEVPGHSPGSICFYCAAQSFIISGDVLFRNSIGRTDLPGGNHQQLLESIRKQLWVLPENTVVYSGHGEPTTIGEEKRTNPFLQ